jgi:hypothetical protein
MLKKLEINTKRQKVYTSDEMLRERGFKQLVTDLKVANSEKGGGYREPPTIVIIGGSHSAFSIACLLINGPFKIPKQFEAPFEFQRQAKQGFYMQVPPKGPLQNYTEYTPGSVPFIAKILYRDKIKVYYSST